MTPFWIGVVIGFFTGVFVGFCSAALFVVGARGDAHLQKYEQQD